MKNNTTLMGTVLSNTFFIIADARELHVVLDKYNRRQNLEIVFTKFQTTPSKKATATHKNNNKKKMYETPKPEKKQRDVPYVRPKTKGKTKTCCPGCDFHIFDFKDHTVLSLF